MKKKNLKFVLLVLVAMICCGCGNTKYKSKYNNDEDLNNIEIKSVYRVLSSIHHGYKNYNIIPTETMFIDAIDYIKSMAPRTMGRTIAQYENDKFTVEAKYINIDKLENVNIARGERANAILNNKQYSQKYIVLADLDWYSDDLHYGLKEQDFVDFYDHDDYLEDENVNEGKEGYTYWLNLYEATSRRYFVVYKDENNKWRVEPEESDIYSVYSPTCVIEFKNERKKLDIQADKSENDWYLQGHQWGENSKHVNELSQKPDTIFDIPIEDFEVKETEQKGVNRFTYHIKMNRTFHCWYSPSYGYLRGKLIKKIGMPIKFSENSNNCEEKWIIDESIIVLLTSYINNKGEKCINLSFENIKM